MKNWISLVGIAITLVAAYLIFFANKGPEMSGNMVVSDPYLRTSTPTSKSGAAFMVLRNETGQDDRLIGARSDLDGMVQLHSHSEDADGVMRMGEIKGGVPIAAGESHSFARGGDHLMFMGLSGALEQGQTVPVTLIFEQAGEVLVTIPVDRER